MAMRPVIVVEDDPFLRMLHGFLDSSAKPAYLAALADFFAHDLADFDGWVRQLRALAGPLYPAEVRCVADQREFAAQLPHAEVVVSESFTIGAAELAQAPKLKVLQKYGTVLRDIDTAACATRGIPVLTLRRRANISCAEHALMLMLTLAKKLHLMHGRISFTQLRAACFDPKIFDSGLTPGSGWPRARGLSTLYGATLGIIGFGEIGREIALRANAFGMRVLVTQRTPLPKAQQREWQVCYASRDELLAASDWVCVQVPLNATTRDSFGAAQFARMQAGAKLINVSRAEIVNRNALLNALRAQTLGGFALDPLYEEPGRADDALLAFDNVILTPHIAAMPRHNALDDFMDLVRGVALAFKKNIN